MNVFIVRSLANDLNTEQGIVRYRVVLLLRLSEIKPLFYRSVQFFLFFLFIDYITFDSNHLNIIGWRNNSEFILHYRTLDKEKMFIGTN